MASTTERNISIGTVTNAGFPYAVAARLGSLVDATPYLVGTDLRPRDFGRILDEHQLLVMGDLPAPPESDSSSPLLRKWLQAGGRLVYFTGWKDYSFLHGSGDLFGVRTPTVPQIRSAPSSIRWLDRPKALSEHLPPLRFLYQASTDSGDVLAISQMGDPAIVRRGLGKGRAAIVLGSISFPAGGAWLLWEAFSDLILFLLDMDDEKLGSPVSLEEGVNKKGFERYSEVLDLASKQQHEEALTTLMRDIPVVSNLNPTLACELCQVLRRIGKRVGDSTSILFSLRFLLDNWTKMTREGGYDYAPFQRHWFQMSHEMDQALWLTGPLKPHVNRGLEALNSHIDTMGPLVPDRDKEALGDMVMFFQGLLRLSIAAEDLENPSSILAEMDRAISQLESAGEAPFTHPRLSAILSYLRLARVLATGPISIDDPSVRRAFAELEKEAQNFSETLDDADFAKSVRVLMNSLSLLADAEEPAAWATLEELSDPFAQKAITTILRLRQLLQLDPLGFTDAFGAVPSSARTQIAAHLIEAAMLRVEGEPLSCTLGFSKDADLHAEVSRSTLLGFRLTEPDSPRKLALAAKVWSAFLCTPSGEVVGTLNGPRTSEQRERVETRAEAATRSRIDQDGAIVSISGRAGAVRVVEGEDTHLTYSTRGWSIGEQISLSTVRIRFGLSEVGSQLLVGMLGDIKDIAESGRYPFHGGTLVAAPSVAQDTDLGDKITPPIKVANLPIERLAGVLSVDLACIVDLDQEALVAVGHRLGPSDSAYNEALKRNDWLDNRGMRHQSAVAYSIEAPDASVFVFSEDGGCLAAKRGEVVRLW